MNTEINKFIDHIWDGSIINELFNFIRIPCVSPAFDSKWRENGYLDKAANLLANWARNQNIKGLSAEIIHLENRAPFLFIEIAGNIEKTIGLYGHLDKMPDNGVWNKGLGPWEPVIHDDRLYGRGSVDNGFSFFAYLAAIAALQKRGIPHPRCVFLIESGEEGGSPDLKAYIEHLRDRIGNPELMICLDSFYDDQKHLWVTTSLRGAVFGNLTVKVLKSDVHSGVGGGIVPHTFAVLRQLLSRIEDEKTGEILLESVKVDIPEKRRREARDFAKLYGNGIYNDMFFADGVKPLAESADEMILNSTWRASLSIIGMDGIPKVGEGAAVISPEHTAQLCLRIPPGSESDEVIKESKTVLEKDPPYGAKVVFEPQRSINGWNAPLYEKGLLNILDQASQDYFADKIMFKGVGGGVGLVGILDKKFPRVPFLMLGAMGPDSNIHSPDENLHIPTAKKLTGCIAYILAKSCK